MNKKTNHTEISTLSLLDVTKPLVGMVGISSSANDIKITNKYYRLDSLFTIWLGNRLRYFDSNDRYTAIGMATNKHYFPND